MCLPDSMLTSRVVAATDRRLWNGNRNLEITVSGKTLTPRELIRSVLIAVMAPIVPDGAITVNELNWMA